MGRSIDVAGTIAGLQLMKDNVREALQQSSSDALKTYRDTAKTLAPVGEPGNSTNPPGQLRDSIRAQVYGGSDGVFRFRVGPRTIYARQRELGGVILPVRAFRLIFHIYGVRVRTERVFQYGSFFMKRTQETQTGPIFDRAKARMMEATTGR